MEQKYQSQNPFLIDLVIERLFRYISFEDLKVARVVCQLWNDRVNPLLLKKTKVKLQPLCLPEFMETNPDPSIYDTFILDSWEFGDLNNVLFDQFLSTYGIHIKDINFCQCVFQNQKTFQDILTKLHKLEILTLGASYVADTVLATNDEEVSGQYPNVSNLEITFGIQNLSMGTWNSIFHYFPNISVLNAQCKSSSNLTDMLLAIFEAKLKLTDFSSFLTEFSETDLTILINSGLQFKNLDINLSASVCAHQLQMLLTCSRHRLKNLKLFHGLGPGYPVGFPFGVSMANLESLELVGDLVESLEFIQLLPRLTNLTILQHDDSEEPSTTYIVRNTPQGLNSHLNLKSLSMEYMLTSECAIELGSRIAPNLTKLSAHLDDSSISSVFENLLNLEELSILGTEVTDEGLTGISMRDLLGEHDNMETYRRYPYIGTCKRLRKVSLYAQSQENVSDYAVQYGLMDASELTVVEIPYSAISDTGILTLHLKPNIVRVSSKYYVNGLDGKVEERSEIIQNY